MRRGVSIIEVLFAIFVVTVGLLGALAVFPVASMQARKGKIADMVAISGRSAVHDFDTRGMRQPARWMAWNAAATPPAYQQFSPVFGQSYCIDPRGIAANPTPADALTMRWFPYSAVPAQPRMVRLTLDRMTVNAAGALAPSGLPMLRPHADSIFVFADDLTATRPDDGSLPAFGSVFTSDHDSNPATPQRFTTRASEGHLSWMATLVPKHELYNGPGAPYIPIAPIDYLLSVVIFNDRPADMIAGDPLHERVVTADFADAGGLGFAGGEVFLAWDAPQSAANDVLAADQLKLRAGDWIMLGGFSTHTLGGLVPSFRWYRVTECDRSPEYHAAESHYAIAASVAGSDWDTALFGNTTDPTVPPIAVIMTGVVGVFEKTIRLE